MNDVDSIFTKELKLLNLLCPNGCGRIDFDDSSLTCPVCHKNFPIINGIPVLFTNELNKKYRLSESTAQSYYRNVQHDYDQTHAVTASGAHLFLEDLERKLKAYLPKIKSVLEIGSGTGFATSCITKLAERTVITDASLEMLSINHARHPNNAAICCPSEALPFPDESFDLIFGNNTFYLVADKDKCALSIRDYLKPGGHFIISEMNPFHPLWPLRFLCSKRWFESSIYHIFPHQMKRRFESAGMKLKAVEYYSYTPYFASDQTIGFYRFIENTFGKIPLIRRFFAFRIFYVIEKV
jgi:ubiquinone/menaquinone biosynthesis C-methylase UbiE